MSLSRTVFVSTTLRCPGGKDCITMFRPLPPLLYGILRWWFEQGKSGRTLQHFKNVLCHYLCSVSNDVLILWQRVVASPHQTGIIHQTISSTFRQQCCSRTQTLRQVLTIKYPIIAKIVQKCPTKLRGTSEYPFNILEAFRLATER